MKLLRGGCAVVIAITAGVILSFGCGGSGGTPAVTPVSINTLDGQTNIPIDSTFQYTFTKAVTASTVTAADFFIVPAPAPAANVIKATFDPTVCNAASAVAATITCSTTAACEIDPTADLQQNTRYAACLSTGIAYSTGEPFEGFMATFSTAGAAPVTVSAKLVRLDGTELNLTDRPIPRVVKVKYIPPAAITVAADQQAFEAAAALKDPANTAVAGAYAWAADGTSVVFTPTARLKYRTAYTVEAGGAIVGTFTTLTKHDINGDGFADVIVGAYTDPASAQGKLYIFYGSATGIANCDISASCAPGATFATGTNGDAVGRAWAFVGDVNGDGYEDFIVGAPGTRSVSGKGTVYLFAGGTALTGTLSASQALATISRAAAGPDFLGVSVSGAGDMNGDGYDDVIIGAPRIGAGFGDGQAFIFLGGTPLTGALDVAVANQVLSGPTDGFIAVQVAGAGDVNGDGWDDVIVSSGISKAYVFYGAAMLASTRGAAGADAIISGAAGVFGNTVAGAGDVNGDGKADVLVGEPANNGKVYVFLGTQLAGPVDATAAFSTINGSGDDWFGASLASAGDVDGDGKDDILIGGFFSDPIIDFGYAYLYLANNLATPRTIANADATFIAANVGDDLGLALGSAADLNGDGFGDILIGAPQYNFNAHPKTTGKGHAYIFYGSASGIASCDQRTTPTCPSATLTGAANDGLGFGASIVEMYP